jgi:hypothetical protein
LRWCRFLRQGLSPSFIAQHLEDYLQKLNGENLYGEQRLPDRLLHQNMAQGYVAQADRKLLDVDFDVRCDVDVASRKVNTAALAYFHHTEFAREPQERRAVVHINLKYPDGRCWNIHAPLQALMNGWGDVETGYQGYAHSIVLMEGDHVLEEHRYIGITKRGWLKRMMEHMKESAQGGNKAFHRAWREYQGRADVMFSSELIILNDTFDRVMSWEEWLVDRYMAEGRSLNMIPGGFKGIKFLHEHRVISSLDITLEERDAAIATWSKAHPRIGMPNLLIAELWKDESYAEKIICGSENRLSIQQVRQVRELAQKGLDALQIQAQVGARTLGQVEGILAGKTYNRII